MLALADRFSDAIDLDDPYSFVSSPWGIIFLLILLPIELIADKIPGVDHVSDLLHSALRPAAAAFMMMALTDERGDVNAVVSLILGLAVGVAVHGYKATTRPHITIASGGVGNPLISMFEDVLVVIVTITALFLPYALIAILPLAGIALFLAYRKMVSGSATLRRLGGLRT
jgi:hypothetical protein